MHCVLSLSFHFVFSSLLFSLFLYVSSFSLLVMFFTFGLFLLQSLGFMWLLSDVTCCLKSEFLKGKIHVVSYLSGFIQLTLSFFKRPNCQQLLTASTTDLTSITSHVAPYRSGHAGRCMLMFISIGKLAKKASYFLH
jgi:hypothetical protein